MDDTLVPKVSHIRARSNILPFRRGRDIAIRRVAGDIMPIRVSISIGYSPVRGAVPSLGIAVGCRILHAALDARGIVWMVAVVAVVAILLALRDRPAADGR